MRLTDYPVATTLGLLVLSASWLGPLPTWAGHSFTAHMTLHMAVVAVAGPLLSIGLAGGKLDPVCVWPRVFAPIPASVGELLIVWGWHAPWLHHFARHSTAGLMIEQLMFLLAGLWVWISACGGSRPRLRERSAMGVIALFLTSMHMTLLGALLALSPRLLFPHHAAGHFLTPLADQHLGGAVMLIVGGSSFLAGGLWLTRDVVGNESASHEAPPAANQLDTLN